MAPPVRSGPRPDGSEAELVLAGRAWWNGQLRPVEVGVDGDGRIVSVGRNVRGARRHDVGERVLLPAATDVHVHLREPGPEAETEGIASGTISAALAGVGLVGEMPNTEPPVTDGEALEEKADRVRGRAAVDVLLYALPTTPRSVGALARQAGAFKVYLSPTTGVVETPSGAALHELLQELARTDLPVVVHAEDPRRFRPAGERDGPVGWSEQRPEGAETAAVDAVLRAPDRLRLHVAHVTQASVAAAARRRGVSCEVTAHHLLLSTASGDDARLKVNPPLRSEAARAALWRAYASGSVPVLASDHAPHPAAQKDRPFELAPSGVPGLETTVPLMLARVGAADLSLELLQRTACDRPARLFGQPLGRLAVGHRANVLVVDFRQKRRIAARRLHAACGWTPFEGREAIFPVEHWRDGVRIVDGGEYVGSATGTTVRPEFAPVSPPRVR